MTRVHDMGGRFGDGPIEIGQPDYPEFTQDWHPRALALTLASGALGKWSIDMARRAREQVSPTDYARFTYYEKWMAGLADLLVETGALSREDLAGDGDLQAQALSERALKADRVAEVLAKGAPADRAIEDAPMFAIGDAVRTIRPAANRVVEGGHTRLPAYAAGVVGRVVRYHGAHVFPDTNAHGLGEAPAPLYAVAFAAKVLWAAPGAPQ